MNNQENHDAFEWLIVHVVLPDTAAASQPRNSKHSSGASDSTEKNLGTSKWPGRGSSTVLEKVKADFNGSSKSAVDRVAQIRISKDGPQQTVASSVLGPSELESLWDDLVEKLKYSILASFDLRVSQYEEDIREKDSQRSLPGWNFNTFFILKEGLARGFENVGLYEDALMGYDELAVGLDVIIRDQDAGAADAHGGTFLGYSQDSKEKLQATLASGGKSDKTGATEINAKRSSVSLDIPRETFPLDASQKPYRDLILANNVSVFDFRAYVFSRQLILLLRASKSSHLRQSEEGIAVDNISKQENFLLLAEACQRTTEFIGLGARTLRRELERSLQERNGEASPRDNVVYDAIDNIVASWTFCASLQVLEQTKSEALAVPETILDGVNSPVDEHSLASVHESIAGSQGPRRPSSATHTSASHHKPISPELFSSDSNSEDDPSKHLRPNPPSRTSVRSTSTKTGTEELASWRADLYLLARQALLDIGKKRGWSIDWSTLGLLYGGSAPNDSDLEEISLEDNEGPDIAERSVESEKVDFSLSGLEPSNFRLAAASRESFNLLYDVLTDHALRHYQTGNKVKSAEKTMADIAVLKYTSGDYESAASYFHRIAPFYGGGHWSLLEGTMLELYAHCLRQLGRKEDYVKILLKLLAKVGAERRSNVSLLKSQKQVDDYLQDIFSIAKEIDKKLAVPLADFFGRIDVDPTIRHLPDKDGFQLQLDLRFLLGSDLMLSDGVEIVLTTADAESQAPKLSLQSQEAVLVRSSSTKVPVTSYTTLYGLYQVEHIALRVGNVSFIQNNATHFNRPSSLRENPSEEHATFGKRPQILVYPTADGLEAKVSSPSYVDLAAPRSLQLEVYSGKNNIKTGALRIKPATAGLRVKVADAKVLGGSMRITDQSGPGVLHFSDVKAGGVIQMTIPYTMENQDVFLLAARLEVLYETEHGEFLYSTKASIDTTLPVSVNVQDIFKADSLFSRFTISPSTLVPLRLLSCHIKGSDHYHVESSVVDTLTMDVFPKQPASLLYTFVQQHRSQASKPEKQPLALTIDFECLDEVALRVVEDCFNHEIASSGVSALGRLLVQHLILAIRTLWTPDDLEMIGLLRQTEVPLYETVNWDTVLRAFSRRTQEEARLWLGLWHKVCDVNHASLPCLTLLLQNNRILLLPERSPSTGRQIVIPVDIPTMPVVHTAELRLLSSEDKSVPVAVGQMMGAELILSHTRAWDKPEAGSQKRPKPPQGSDAKPCLEFSYELHANPEVWLIGGRRRGNFQGSLDKVETFPVMLLPQRPGHLLLPSLEIKTYVVESSGNKRTSRSAVTSELDYRSHAHSVLVLPDLRSTTVSLEGAGGSWLLDSDRRVHINSG